MREDQSHHSVDPERGGVRNCFFQQFSRNPAAAEFFIDIDAEFNRAAVGAARKKTFETEPSDHAAPSHAGERGNGPELPGRVRAATLAGGAAEGPPDGLSHPGHHHDFDFVGDQAHLGHPDALVDAELELAVAHPARTTAIAKIFIQVTDREGKLR